MFRNGGLGSSLSLRRGRNVVPPGSSEDRSISNPVDMSAFVEENHTMSALSTSSKVKEQYPIVIRVRKQMIAH